MKLQYLSLSNVAEEKRLVPCNLEGMLCLAKHNGRYATILGTWQTILYFIIIAYNLDGFEIIRLYRWLRIVR